MLTIDSAPYPFPHHGLSTAATALIVIDMQADFLLPSGYLAAMGYDLAGTRAAIPGVKKLLAAARTVGLKVFHTRQGYRPDLADLPPHKAARSRRGKAPIGAVGPLGRFLIRGEPGFAIIDEVAPIDGEPVIDKSANGAFWGTELAAILHAQAVQSLIVAGITTDVCVHSTIREANDRGYECLLVSDACGSGDAAAHQGALHMMTVEGGIFGAVAPAAAVVEALQQLRGRGGA
jgi:nicotinamidase-related amidase